MWGSTVPSIHYGFHCDPALRRAYWAKVSLLAAGCVAATLHPRFRSPALRPYRAAMYASLGLSALVFVGHGLRLRGWAQQRRSMSLDWMAAMGTCNFLGAAAYAARVPERWYPRRFDLVGSSHQILHVMVILAGLAHWRGLMQAYRYTHSQPALYG